MRVLGNLFMVDGPLVVPRFGMKMYGVGSVNDSQPFGNTVTGGVDSIADVGVGGDQLGTILRSEFNVFDGITPTYGGFQGDYIQYGDASNDDLRILAMAGAHSGGCVIHILGQTIGVNIDGGSVLGAAQQDAYGGKAAICFDSQFNDGPDNGPKLANLTIGTATGQNLNWQNHFISFACPIRATDFVPSQTFNSTTPR